MKYFPFITANVHPQREYLVRGKGVHVFDRNGKKYVDLTCQTLNLALGHGNETVRSSIMRQLKGVWFASSRFGTGPFIELSKQLVDMAPPNMGAVNLKLSNGSDAVETAVKIARLYTREHTVICVKNAWHGESGTTLGFSSVEARKSYVVSETNVVFSQEPTLESLLDAIETTPHAAAVLLDPVGVSCGLFTEPDARTYLSRIREACTKRGIVLIFDEIQTFGGFLGNTLFAADYFGVYPDIICLGKALGAGLPLAATICAEHMRGVLDYNNAEYTYGGQALPCAAALGALKEYRNTSSRIADAAHAWKVSVERIMRTPDLEVRSFGFITTVTRAQNAFRDVWSAEVERQALKAGYIVRKNDRGRRILLKPPVVIEEHEAKKALLTLRTIMLRVDRTLTRGTRGLVRKELSDTHKHEWYADALLRSLGNGCGARTMTALEQHMLSERLNDLGVPAARVYADSPKSVIYAFQEGVSADRWLASLQKEEQLSEAYAYFIRQQNAVELAHDHGIVIGDRWPGNTIMNGSNCVFVDFDISYEGDFRTLAAFEELFCLFQSLAYLGNIALAEKIAGPFVRGVLRRHGHVARKVWGAMFSFYTQAEKPANSTSLPVQSYRKIASLVSRHIEGSPRANPTLSTLDLIGLRKKKSPTA